MNKESKIKILTGFFWKFGERILAISTSFIVTMVLSRLLSPEEYGEVALAMVIINLADIFVTAGLGNSLIQKKDADEIDFSSAFYLNILIALVIYICIFCISPALSKFLNYDDLDIVIKILCIRIPIAAVNSIQQAYVSKKMDFQKFFWSTLGGTILSGIVGIILAYEQLGVWALVVQYLLNTIVDTIILWIFVKWRPKSIFNVKRVKVLYSYGWKLMVAGILNAVYNQMQNLIIGKKYSTESLAYYTNGTQYPQAATSAINTSISSVLFPALSSTQDSLENVKKITRQAISVSSYLLWPIMFCIIVIAPSFVSLILTDKWLPCVPFIQIACIVYGFWPVHTANLEALKATGHSEIFLKLEIIKCSIALGVLCISMRYGVMAIAISSIITSIISSFINAYPNRTILNYSYWEQVKDVIPSFLKAFVMALFVMAISKVIKNKLFLLIIQLVICVVLYILISVLTKDKNLKYLKEFF